MGKIKRSLFNTIFAVSLACLFALQGMWLYYVYQMEKMKVQEILDKSLLNAVLREMEERFSLIGERRATDNLHTDSSGTAFSGIVFEYKNNENDGDLASQQFNFIQKILLYENILFSLTKLDSIYSSDLSIQNIYVQYQLNYFDFDGKIIESSGGKINKGFSTNLISVVNDTKVGAVVRIPPPVILKNMLGILIISVLIFILIIACLIYQVNIFLTQNQLHQLRRNFVHTLNHNMKTPLASIHSVLTQLNNNSLDLNPELKSKFTTIAIDQTISLQTITDQLLTVAYANDRKLTLNKQKVDLPQMIRSLAEQFMIRNEKDIEFSEKYDFKDNPVYADPFYLKNAISNMIDNAIKYSGNSVKIDIECKMENNRICICIKDTGFGISEKDQQKVYDPFERGAEINRKQKSGFGLGLSYVKYVIEAHGGSLDLVSQEGIGSEFTITIPMN